MKRLHTIEDIRRYRHSIDRPVALVPTMGALHAGHLSLIEAARRLTDEVWVSIFVNPAQFGPSEDLAKYPRPIEDDLKQCEAAGVSAVFEPSAEEVYPPGVVAAAVDVPSLTAEFEGENRPAHFAGVCRVVLKLFNICQPTFACFGQKDYQQLVAIEAMVADLNLPIAVQRVATMREADGLAMSSRNRYLDEGDRRRARGLYRALELARTQIVEDGETDPDAVEAGMRGVVRAHGITLDYAAVRHPGTLKSIDTIDRPVVALIAGRLGKTRLLDNLIIKTIV